MGRVWRHVVRHGPSVPVAHGDVGRVRERGVRPICFASLETQQQARSTAGRFKSTDAACGPSPAHRRRPPSRHAVVNDPIDPFDVMSVEAPAFDPDLYKEQLLRLAEARSREEPEDGG